MFLVMACETPHPLVSSIQMLKRNEAATVWQYRFYITQPNGKSFDYRKTSRCEDFENISSALFKSKDNIANTFPPSFFCIA